MRLHDERRQRLADLALLDPAVDWHEIYKRLTLWELPAEARLGFQLAFYRPFAVPRMAEVLRRTGHFRRETTRRAYDTGIVIHEIIWGGVDSERGNRMVRLMNALHDRPDIYQEDMTYLLNAVIVVPTRFMDRFGWRTVNEQERQATWRFFDVLGERMGIADRPASYAQAEEWFEAYETRYLGRSDSGDELTAAVLETLRDRLPSAARPWSAHVTSTLIGDRAVSAALGLPPPGRVTEAALAAVAAARRQITGRRRPPDRPSFWPGRPAGTVYPQGYQLDQLGPTIGRQPD